MNGSACMTGPRWKVNSAREAYLLRKAASRRCQVPIEKMWVEWPDGTDLSNDKSSPGAKSALARDGNNDLKAHAKLRPIDEDEESSPSYEHAQTNDDEPGLGAALAGLALIGLTVGAVAAAGSFREKKSQRRELEWSLAEARRAEAQAAAANPRV